MQTKTIAYKAQIKPIHVKYKIVVDIRRDLSPCTGSTYSVFSAHRSVFAVVESNTSLHSLRNIIIIVALRLCFFPLDDRSTKAYIRIVVVDFDFLSSADLLENQLKYALQSIILNAKWKCA